MGGYLVHHLLQQSAEQFPEKAAVVFQGKALSYADLDYQSSKLALQLVQLGIEKGDRVGILLPKSLEAIVSLFGIMKAGAIYVPIDPAAPVGRIASIVNHCGTCCLITTCRKLASVRAESAALSGITKAIVVDNQGDRSPFPARFQADFFRLEDTLFDLSGYRPVEQSDSNPAYLLHTSGSTGKPKGVAISHRNALTFITTAAVFFSIGEQDRFCSQAPLHFDLSVFDLFVALACGATVVLLPELLNTFPVKLAECIEHEQITVWNSVSSVLTMLADKGMLAQRCLDSVRLVHFSGDLMPVKYLRILTENMKNASFYNIYGQTEANSSLYYPIKTIPDGETWKIPVGKPFPNFEVFALGDDGTIIDGSGGEGELYVSSSSVALGYWNDEAMTHQKFVPDPRFPLSKKTVYRTGDLVRVDEQGNYVFTGRKDDMVKSRGYRIELGEIESVLSNHPEITAVVALPVPDQLIGNRIAVLVVPKDGLLLKKEELFGYCTARLPQYMIPEKIEFRHSLPSTSTGKIDRKTLAMSLQTADEYHSSLHLPTPEA